MILTMSLIILIILTWKINDVRFFIVIILLSYLLSMIIEYLNK